MRERANMMLLYCKSRAAALTVLFGVALISLAVPTVASANVAGTKGRAVPVLPIIVLLGITAVLLIQLTRQWTQAAEDAINFADTLETNDQERLHAIDLNNADRATRGQPPEDVAERDAIQARLDTLTPPVGMTLEDHVSWYDRRENARRRMTRQRILVTGVLFILFFLAMVTYGSYKQVLA